MAHKKAEYKPFKIKCGCGCLVDRCDMVTAKKLEDGTPVQHLRCKEHRHLDIARAEYRVTNCNNCSTEFKYDAGCGITPFFCTECHVKAVKKRNRGYALKRRKEVAEGVRKTPEYQNLQQMKSRQGDPERWMCVHWDGKCYDNAVKHNLQTRPCKGCKEFIPAPQNHDPLFSRYSDKGPKRKQAYSRK